MYDKVFVTRMLLVLEEYDLPAKFFWDHSGYSKEEARKKCGELLTHVLRDENN